MYYGSRDRIGQGHSGSDEHPRGQSRKKVGEGQIISQASEYRLHPERGLQIRAMGTSDSVCVMVHTQEDNTGGLMTF